MFEIELKARVRSPAAVKESLNAFAVFTGSIVKEDQYWKLHRDGRTVSVRLREETRGREGEKTTTVTYKRKELRHDTEGVAYEVNDEQEFTLSEAAGFLHILRDAGFSAALRKVKKADVWRAGRATAELCEVPPLGFFLEIEILSPVADEKTVAEARKELESVLRRGGLGPEDIEARYYSELLDAHPQS